MIKQYRAIWCAVVCIFNQGGETTPKSTLLRPMLQFFWPKWRMDDKHIHLEMVLKSIRHLGHFLSNASKLTQK